MIAASHEARRARGALLVGHCGPTWGSRVADARARRAAVPRLEGPLVGASIWQTPGGVQSELATINDDVEAFGTELEQAVRSRGYPDKVEPAAQPLIDVYTRAWLPLQKAWKRFYADNNGWWGNLWWNHAPEAEQYAQKLVEVRAKAGKAGLNVLSPTPLKFAPSLLFDPQHNLFDDAGHALPNATTDLWKIVKIALAAGLGVLGIAALLQVVRLHGDVR